MYTGKILTMKKITRGMSSVAASVHFELIQLTDKMDNTYKLTNGRTALYWHLVQVIDSHVQKGNIKKLSK